MRAHCRACARPTEVRNYDNVRACCSDCLTPYRDDAAVWEVPTVVATLNVVAYYPDTPKGAVTAPAKAKEAEIERRRIAWALFCLETMAEVTRIAEGQGTEHKVRLVMWARTRTEIRDRCLARAAEVANWMVFDPEEVAS